MTLQVVKRFTGIVEGKTLNPGDILTSDDVARINTLVGRGLCVIVSIDNPTANAEPTGETATDKERRISDGNLDKI